LQFTSALEYHLNKNDDNMITMIICAK